MTSDDTFTTIIDDIQTIVTDIGLIDAPSLGQPLTTAIDLLGDVIDLLQLVDDINDAWNLIVTAWDTLEGIMDTVTAFVELVPGLDVVLDVFDAIDGMVSGAADTLGTVLSSVVETTDEILPILQDVERGLNDVKALLGTLTGDMPAFLDTVKMVEALFDIASTLAGVFPSDSAVGTRLNALVAEYDALQTAADKAVAPLETAFEALKKALAPIGDALSDIKKVVGTGFSDMVSAFQWASDKVQMVMHAATSAANALAPVRWVLDKVQSVEEKVLDPIIDHLENAVGLGALKKELVNDIKSKLAFDALQSFAGTGSQQTTISSGQASTGGTAAKGMRDAFALLGQSLDAYQRGDTKTAVTDAIEGLLDAITGGTIDLSGPAPNLPSTPPSLSLPPLPPPTPTRAAAWRARPPRPSPAVPPSAVPALLALGQSLIRNPTRPRRAAVTPTPPDPPPPTPADTAADDALVNAATTLATSLSATAALVPPAQSALAALTPYLGAPADAALQFGILADIAQSLSDTLATAVSLYPSELQGWTSVTTPIAQLATDLGTIAAGATALVTPAGDFATALDAARAAVPGAAATDGEAHQVAALLTGAGAVLELLSMLDQLAEGQAASYQPQVSAVHTTFDTNATALATSLGTLSSPNTAVSDALSGMTTAAQGALPLFEALAAHATPIAATWVPQLQAVDRCAKAIDAILDPLSYLLTLGGCTDAAPTAVGSGPDLKALALAAAHVIRDAALTAMKDILDGLPAFLVGLTDEVLGVPAMKSAVAAATSALPGLTQALTSGTTPLAANLAALASGTKPPLEFTWVDPRTGNTLTLSNAFFSQDDVTSITTLVMSLLGEAVAQGRALPDASPLIISWRKS